MQKKIPDEQNVDILYEDRTNIADLFWLRPLYDKKSTVSQQSPLRAVDLAAIISSSCPSEVLKDTPNIISVLLISYCHGFGLRPKRVAFILVSQPAVSPGPGPPQFFPTNQDTSLSKGFLGLPIAYKLHFFSLTNIAFDSCLMPNFICDYTPHFNTPNFCHFQLLTRLPTSKINSPLSLCNCCSTTWMLFFTHLPCEF